jgi:hypothetical protein
MDNCGYSVSIGVLPNGRYIAASTCAPYYCCEGSSEEEVKALVDRALAFHAKARAALRATPVKSRVETRVVTKLIPTRVFQPEGAALAVA